MRNKAASAERARWVPLAAGVVLEVGAGSGLNFAHYASARAEGLRARSLRGVAPDGRSASATCARPGRVPGRSRRGHSAARRVRGHRGQHLDALHDRRCGASAARDGAGAPRRRPADLRRTRALARSACRPLAGPPDADLAQDRRRLSSESTDRPVDRGERVRDPGDRTGLYQRSACRCLPLSRGGAAPRVRARCSRGRGPTRRNLDAKESNMANDHKVGWASGMSAASGFLWIL